MIDCAGGVLVNTTIGGQSFSAAVQSGLQGGIASFVGEIGANYIGGIGNATAGQNIARYALHGVLGCGIGAIQGDCAAGAIGAVTAELAERFGVYGNEHQPFSPYADNASTALARLIGTTAAALAGRDAVIGGMAGENAVRNNSIASCVSRGGLPGCNQAGRQLPEPPLSMGAPAVAAVTTAAIASSSSWWDWLFGSSNTAAMDAHSQEPITLVTPVPDQRGPDLETFPADGPRGPEIVSTPNDGPIATPPFITPIPEQNWRDNVVTNQGSLEVLAGATPDSNELRAGNGLTNIGYNVQLQPTASSQGIDNVPTADMRVEGVGQVDVYSPTTTNPNSIARAIEDKARQGNGVFVQSDMSAADAAAIANRIWGKPTANNITTIFFQNSSGIIIRFDRPAIR